MNGTKYFFDTNALIHFFKGYPGLQAFTRASVCLSIISVLEYLSFPRIREEEKNLLYQFLNEVEVINLRKNNTALLDAIILLRSSYKIKVPDAIITATAIYKNAVLTTNNKHFSKITSLQIINF